MTTATPPSGYEQIVLGSSPYADDPAFPLHERGKIEVRPTVRIRDNAGLALAYTPGVGRVSQAIADQPELAWEFTWKGNAILIVTDGTAVLGLGDIGPEAALPVMEGKSLLFKEFGQVDCVPICLATQDVSEIVETVVRIAPAFGGVNLEDISAPRCFEIEQRLQDALDIPVFHDDQHGTAIVTSAALRNACTVTGRELGELRVVISGAGAAGVAIADMLTAEGVRDIVVCDRQGALVPGREGMTEVKSALAVRSNPRRLNGSLNEVLRGADVLIGVSGGAIPGTAIEGMAEAPIVFALANPIPEILPDDARRAGASIVATGRSDFPNQINNVLAFPGVFRGALDVRARSITSNMKRAAAAAIANFASGELTAERIIPDPFDHGLADAVAHAVAAAATLDGVARL